MKPSNVTMVSILTELSVECSHSAQFGTTDRLGNQPVKSAHVSPFPVFKYYYIMSNKRKSFDKALSKEKKYGLQ